MTVHMDDLRQHLLDTLSDLRDKKKPMDPNRARAVAQVAGVLVDTARVEVEYLRATTGKHSGFMDARTPALENRPDGHSPLQAVENGVRTVWAGLGQKVA